MLQDTISRRDAVPGNATTATAEDVATPRSIADRYEVIRLIGGGGMGRVFVAYDHSLKRNVAIKMLASRLAGDSDFAQQLLREARANVGTIHFDERRYDDTTFALLLQRLGFLIAGLIGGALIARRLQRR